MASTSLRAAELSPFGPASPVSPARLEALETADQTHLWKPFTQMAGYVDERPLIIEEGRGNWLRDVRGRSYLDGVSSLWVNVHGHAHPRIVARVQEQIARLDHSTMLGPSNVPAAELAERLVRIAPGQGRLSRVFYSDSGSTSVEVAVKMAYQYFAQHRDPQRRGRDVFVSLTNAYHGDTLGSVSVGGIDLFHAVYEPLLFSTRKTPGPDPYHRAFGQDPAVHEQACLDELSRLLEECGRRVAALVIEPLMQGAAGMLRHSENYLREAVALARSHGALVICDEVATGFGRSGRMFACDLAGVVPDLLCLAKGISGGVLPLAATLATEEIHQGFLGEHSEYRTFFHGHSYTGNPIACAAALASLDVFEEEKTLEVLAPRIDQLATGCQRLAALPAVGDVRRLGVMTGIELVRDSKTGEPWDPSLRVAHRVIVEALEQGVLLRPLGNVVVLMPPLSISEEELALLLEVVEDCIQRVTGEL